MARNYDQIRTESPFTVLDGTETVTLNQGGITKGGFLSIVRSWIANTIGTTFGRSVLNMANIAALQTAVLPATASDVDLETATEEDPRQMSPSLLAGAILYHAKVREALQIADNIVLDEGDLDRIIISDGVAAVEVELPAIADIDTSYYFVLINLAEDAVTLTPVGTTLIGTSGALVDVTIPQYGSIDALYLGSDTWYIKEN